jgi:hypothetical protein
VKQNLVLCSELQIRTFTDEFCSQCDPDTSYASFRSGVPGSRLAAEQEEIWGIFLGAILAGKQDWA